MTQPKYAPIELADEVRPAAELQTAQPWFSHRPGERAPGPRRTARGIGSPGPDQGYALLLARRAQGEFVLGQGEHKDDAVTGVVVVAMRRAALFGRAPVRADVEFAVALFGYRSAAPHELVELRRTLVSGLSHDYRRQRELADAISDDLLRRPPEDVSASSSLLEHLIAAVSAN